MSKQFANPAVAVVIPTYNRAEDLRRCLDSLVAQTFDNFEVLVCDDGSTDNTADVAMEFNDRLDIQFETAENFGGPARPRNRGVAMARAPYIAFLDSDDWWAPAKLERSVTTLDAGADLVYHDLHLVWSHDQMPSGKRVVSTAPRHPMFVSLLCSITSTPNSSVVVRRDLLDRIGGISENRDLISAEDFDTWIRVSRLTENFVRLPECLGYYWVGSDSISACTPRQVTVINAVFSQYLADLPAKNREQAEGILAYRLGRIFLTVGDIAMARKHLLTAVLQPINLADRAKAGYFLVNALFSRRPT
ncbi:MAG: glycosyltransferase family 2 protein [Sulfuritalea sp.]|jgi:glycosyltransferase involved in cell wall biosynthesis|nr:glycosyltransferase family 2 protein [Sulfuritalea sp.]